MITDPTTHVYINIYLSAAIAICHCRHGKRSQASIIADLGLFLAQLRRHGKRSQASLIAVLGLFLAQLRRNGKRSQASLIAKGIDTHMCIYGGGYPEEAAPLHIYIYTHDLASWPSWASSWPSWAL